MARRLWVAAIAGLLMAGGCPRPEDSLEPNDTLATATALTLGETVEGRVVQGNADVFTVASTGETMLHFELRSRGDEEEACAAFRVTGPDTAILYDDNARSCSRGLDTPLMVPDASLQYTPGVGYDLRVPATQAGTYTLTITELGHADNIFTYSWAYELKVRAE